MGHPEGCSTRLQGTTPDSAIAQETEAELPIIELNPTGEIARPRQ
jgi:hypothetical protein